MSPDPPPGIDGAPSPRDRARLERRLTQQAFLSDIGRRALKPEVSLADLLAQITTEARALLGLDTIGIVESPPERPGFARIVAHATHEALGLALLDEAELSGISRGPDGGETWIEVGSANPMALAFESGRVVISTDRVNDPRFAPATGGWETMSWLVCAPIIAGARIWGAIAGGSREAARNAEDDTDLLGALANVVAGAIERQSYEETLRHRALHDRLTGLPNRIKLVGLVEQALSEPGGDRPTVIASIELDHFKHLNDAYGHDLGDRLLLSVSDRLIMESGADAAARLGGDEFALLWRAGDSDLDAVGERVVALFDAPFRLPLGDLYVSASVGVVASGGEPISAEHLIRDADTAMYRAKELGRRRHALFGAELRDRAAAHVQIASALRLAAERDEIVLHYQPVVRLDDGTLSGFEALVRWRRPGSERLVMPGEFIELAEDSGLIHPIGLRIAELAFQQLALWNADRSGPPLRMSVNVSGRQMDLPGLAERFVAIAEQAGIDTASVALELTESVLIDGSGAAGHFVRTARDAGFKLSIDDFGTGYASLSYLRQFEPDELKLDRSFVNGLGRSSADTAIVTGTLRIAHELGLSVTAEGVEEREQVEVLRTLGCRHAQGYWFARPADAETATGIIRAAQEPRAIDAPLAVPGSTTAGID